MRLISSKFSHPPIISVVIRFPSLKQLLNSLPNILNILTGFEEINDLSFLINDKLGKIPWDNSSLIRLGIVQFTVVSQKHE